MESFLLIVDLFLLLGLIGLLIYESRQLVNYKAQMELFIESNSEIFGVVNVNAGVSREIQERVLTLEKFAELSKGIMDVHAHALRVYPPNWQTLEESTKIQTLENF